MSSSSRDDWNDPRDSDSHSGRTKPWPEDEDIDLEEMDTEEIADLRAVYDGLDLPCWDDFDYKKFIAREFGEGKEKRSFMENFWRVTAIIMLIIFGLAVGGLALLRFLR